MTRLTPDRHRHRLQRQLQICAEARRDWSPYSATLVRMTPQQARRMWLLDGDTFCGARVEITGYGCAEESATAIAMPPVARETPRLMHDEALGTLHAMPSLPASFANAAQFERPVE